MTDEAAREYRSSIIDILTRHRLSWIADQADEKISLGRLVTKRVDAGLSGQDPITGETRRASRRAMTEFLSSEPYGETEKLEILLEAIELGLIAPVKMEHALAESLASVSSVIHFRSEDGSVLPQHDIELTDAAIRRHDTFAKSLQDAVNHIRSLL